MKIALAQINTTIGDFDGNVDKILEFANRARESGAELCVFPEQCIPGYPAHDLLERPRFIDHNLRALEKITTEVRGIAVIVGFAERYDAEWGKGLYNSAALIDDGQVVSIHRKSLLPTYDVFDERRYFDPSHEVRVCNFRGVRLGITICEDIWNDPDFWTRRLYPVDPAAELVNMGVDMIINIAASPFTIEKRHLRRDMLKAAAVDHGVALLYVNSVGGNDDLVFEGVSQAYSSDGKLLARGKEFEEDLVLLDTVTCEGDLRAGQPDDEVAALNALILGTRDYAQKCNFKSGLLGLSGGIDSALVAAIGAVALGAENLEVVLMPSRYSSQGSIDDSLELARNLGLKHRTIPIDDLFSEYLDTLEPVFQGLANDTTEENIQARIRGNILMALSNKFGHLILTTGNKSELATGYCTLYGDMAGGLAVISDVPKKMVYRLCEVINRNGEIIPRSIIEKPPSAELSENQTDQDSLPAYDLLDAILEQHIVHGSDHPAIVSQGFDPDLVDQVLSLVRRNEYKRRQAPPGIKLTSKAFGFGRRIPIAQKWNP